MSNSGWGGPADGPPDGVQNGPHGGAPRGRAPHGDQAYPGPGPGPGPGYGSPAPTGPGGPGGPGFGGPQHPSGPPGPQHPGGAGGFSQQPPTKRPWALITVALGCVLAMVLVVGGGLTYLVLSRGGDDATVATDAPADTTPAGPETSGEAASPTPAEQSAPFEVVVPYDPPTGSPDELWEVMSDNPLTAGTLPTLSTCELPETPVQPSVEQLEAVLNAAAICLNQLWATTSSDRDLPWISPKVVVYTHPDVPASAVCDSGFSADAPRMCNLDSTIYWPVGFGAAQDLTDPADVPSAYLWDLAFVYTNTASWNSSLTVYYGTMRNELETTDPERFDEAWRRFTLQRMCLGSAASMQFTSDVEPSPALRDLLSDPASWTDGEPPRTVSADSQALWIDRGFTSGGDISVCNAWVADLDQVS